jgi:NitT/TauT family transport system substrate-binding protein
MRIPVVLAALAGTVLAFGAAGEARGEASELRVARQFGLGYIQFDLMEDGKLIEKHAKAAGLGDVKVTWATFRSSDVMNDALISNTIDFASVGAPGLATIWSRTRGNIDVRGVVGFNQMPLYLNTRNPNVNSIRDFTDKDKIALPAIKVAVQAIILQMAAAKEWGDANYAKLDPLTVSMAHPDGLAALVSGQSEITAHFTSPPFQYRELEKPGIRTILNSFDVVGGPMSFNVVAAPGKFRTNNPKLYDVFIAALDEATASINKDKRAAAEIYKRVRKDPTEIDELVKMMNAPGVAFTTVPTGCEKIAEFMHKVGTIKIKPGSWKDMFFPNAHAMEGS